METGPASPAEVEDDGEPVLAEEAAAVGQAAGQVLVVYEHKLNPHANAGLGCAKGIREPWSKWCEISNVPSVSLYLFNICDLWVGSITANILATLVVCPSERFVIDITEKGNLFHSSNVEEAKINVYKGFLLKS